MRRFFFILLSVISLNAQGQFLMASAGIDTSHPAVVDTLPLYGKTVSFMGNSITLGIASSPQATSRWTYLFCQSRGATEDNHGVSGQTLQPNLCGGSTFSNTTIPTYNSSTHGALVIALGTNDIGHSPNGGYSSTTYETTLEATINYAHNTKGWPYAKIVVLTPFYAIDYDAYLTGVSCTPPIGATGATQTVAADYATKALQAATNTGAKGIDIRALMIAAGFNTSYYSADHLHENNTGHAAIASLLTNRL